VCRSLNDARDLIQEVLPDQPTCAAERRHHNVNLAYAGQAMVRARVRPRVGPRRPVLRTVLFDGDLTKRSRIPLRTVCGIPKRSLQAALRVDPGPREF
jgi:hypothetical protein